MGPFGVVLLVAWFIATLVMHPVTMLANAAGLIGLVLVFLAWKRQAMVPLGVVCVAMWVLGLLSLIHAGWLFLVVGAALILVSLLTRQPRPA